MPRWDPSRSRPLVLDLDFFPTSSVRGPRGGRLPAGAHSSGVTGGNSGGGRQGGRGGGRGPSGSRSTPAGDAGSGPVGLGDYAETEGGLMVIDDHMGSAGGESAPAFPTLGAGAGGGSGFTGYGTWGRGRPPPTANTDEEFPSLATAAAAGSTLAAPGSRAYGGGGFAAAAAAGPAAGADGAGAPGALRKATSRCPCGRRMLHHALRAGEVPPPLQCDRDCEIMQRRQQLARAFDVSDPEQHASYFDRHRTPEYTPALLQVRSRVQLDPQCIKASLPQFIPPLHFVVCALLASFKAGNLRWLLPDCAGGSRRSGLWQPQPQLLALMPAL